MQRNLSENNERDISVSVPFPMDKQAEKTTYTYLDTTGRQTIVIEKHNVVDEYTGQIKVLFIVILDQLLSKRVKIVTEAFRSLGIHIQCVSDFHCFLASRLKYRKRSVSRS